MIPTHLFSFISCAKQLHLQAGASPSLPACILISDHERVKHISRTMSFLPQGSIVIARDYNHPERRKYIEYLKYHAKRYKLKWLVAGDVTLARTLKADGMHLPSYALEWLPLLRRQYPHWIITVAAHSYRDLVCAYKGGANAALLSPVFPTNTHPEAVNLGLLSLRRLVCLSRLPIYALGGVNQHTIKQLKGSGVIGIAAIQGYSNSTSKSMKLSD